MKSLSKQYIIIGSIILFIVVGAVVFTYTRSKTEQAATLEKETVFEDLPEAIPTVDSGVILTIEGKTESVMTVKSIPAGTKAIEYELTYDTASGSIEGVFGAFEIKKSFTTAEEKFIFGTSSSGVNRYHTIKGPVKAMLKFTGRYGTRLLEKEFRL